MGNPALEIEWNSMLLKYRIHWPGEKEKSSVIWVDHNKILPVFIIVTGNALIVLYLAQQPPPPLGQGLLIQEVPMSHTKTHHSRLDE
jgi:hypothetical protein